MDRSCELRLDYLLEASLEGARLHGKFLLHTSSEIPSRTLEISGENVEHLPLSAFHQNSLLLNSPTRWCVLPLVQETTEGDTTMHCVS